MLELLFMSLLGVSYINASINESIEEKNQREKERIRNLKIKVFCYSIRHKFPYDEVVKSLQNKTLSFDELDK